MLAKLPMQYIALFVLLFVAQPLSHPEESMPGHQLGRDEVSGDIELASPKNSALACHLPSPISRLMLQGRFSSASYKHPPAIMN